MPQSAVRRVSGHPTHIYTALRCPAQQHDADGRRFSPQVLLALIATVGRRMDDRRDGRARPLRALRQLHAATRRARAARRHVCHVADPEGRGRGAPVGHEADAQPARRARARREERRVRGQEGAQEGADDARSRGRRRRACRYEQIGALLNPPLQRARAHRALCFRTWSTCLCIC